MKCGLQMVDTVGLLLTVPFFSQVLSVWIGPWWQKCMQLAKGEGADFHGLQGSVLLFPISSS